MSDIEVLLAMGDILLRRRMHWELAEVGSDQFEVVQHMLPVADQVSDANMG